MQVTLVGSSDRGQYTVEYNYTHLLGCDKLVKLAGHCHNPIRSGYEHRVLKQWL